MDEKIKKRKYIYIYFQIFTIYEITPFHAHEYLIEIFCGFITFLIYVFNCIQKKKNCKFGTDLLVWIL